MKHKASVLIVVIALISVVYHYLPASRDGTVEVIIAHFNDLGGRARADRRGRGGITKLAGAWRRIQSKHPGALLLVAGDMITGSALSTLTRGEAIFRLANRMDIAVFAPGNHEFDYGVAQYLKLLRIATFPFIAANLRPRGTLENIALVDAPYVILDASGVKVGVIGITHPDTPFLTFRKNTQGVEFSEPAQSVREAVKKVDRRAQLVVALTHIGMDGDRKLARRVRGIDIIIGGHSPEATYRPLRVGKTWIAHAGDNGNYLGIMRVRLIKTTEKLKSVKGELIFIGPRTRPDPDMKAAVDAEERKLPVRLDEVIARSNRRYGRNEKLAAWIASIMKEYAGADIGLVNVGGVRADFEQGPITRRDVYRVMPFDNRLVVIEIHGKTLARWLKTGRFVTDKPVRPNQSRSYKVATMDFVASTHRLSSTNVHSTSITVRELMIRDLKRRGTLRL